MARLKPKCVASACSVLNAATPRSRPFRTISRAIIEAGIITSRDYLDLTLPLRRSCQHHCCCRCSYCSQRSWRLRLQEWEDGKEPTDDELIAFNPAKGGVIIPSGCSVVSLDLRKTIIRPDYVPSPQAENDGYGQRSAIFRVTGGCYFLRLHLYG